MTVTEETLSSDRYIIFRNYVTKIKQQQLISSMITLHIHHSIDYKSFNNNIENCSSFEKEVDDERDIEKKEEKYDDNNDEVVSSENVNKNRIINDILNVKPLKETHDFESSHASKSLDLGLAYCGAPFIDNNMLLVIDITRRACKHASKYYRENNNNKNIVSTLDKMSKITTNYTGICLAYGPKSKMTPHYDSPTSHAQSDIKQEWLVMITLGNTMLFQMNDTQILLYSGDVVVMDAMNVLHGVVSIIENDDDNIDPAFELGLNIPGSRMGILSWQASSHPPPRLEKRHDDDNNKLDDDNEEAFHDLFQDDSSQD